MSGNNELTKAIGYSILLTVIGGIIVNQCGGNSPDKEVTPPTLLPPPTVPVLVTEAVIPTPDELQVVAPTATQMLLPTIIGPEAIASIPDLAIVKVDAPLVPEPRPLQNRQGQGQRQTWQAPQRQIITPVLPAKIGRPYAGNYFVRVTNPPHQYGMHGEFDYEAEGYPQMAGADFVSEALLRLNQPQAVLAPFPGFAEFVTERESEFTGGNSLELVGTGEWEHWVYIYYHVSRGVDGQVTTGQQIAIEENSIYRHTHNIVMYCIDSNNRNAWSCIGVPALAILAPTDLPDGVYTHGQTHNEPIPYQDDFLPSLDRLWLPADATTMDWSQLIANTGK